MKTALRSRVYSSSEARSSQTSASNNILWHFHDNVVAFPHFLRESLAIAAWYLGLMFMASLLWPVLHPALRFLLSGVNLQRPSHSFTLSDGPMPVEARMLGIFGGFAVAALLLVSHRAEMPTDRPYSLWWFGALTLLLLAMDGANAFSVDLGLQGAYAPNNGLRLLTGVLAGAAVGLLSVPLLARNAASASTHLATWKPVLLRLALAEAMFLLCAACPWDIPARAAVMVGAFGVVLPLWLATGQILALALRRHVPYPRWMATPALFAVIAELTVLAFLRVWAENLIQ